ERGRSSGRTAATMGPVRRLLAAGAPAPPPYWQRSRGPRPARAHAAIGGLLILALSRVAWPSPGSPSARLVYGRSAEAASCPAEPALRTAVAARFGYDPFFPWAKATIVVQVSRIRSLYVSRVQLLDEQGIAQGVRELSSSANDCSEIFDATALAISIA